jgi:hypothetical protein
MKEIILFMVVLLAGDMLFAQKKPDSKKPDEQIKVNKEYDENGNLIGYDSTYVRSWSSDTTLNLADMDVLRREMESMMKDGGFGSFFGDSTNFAHDPFRDLHKDFFERFYRGIPDSAFNWNDTTNIQIPGMEFPFSDFDQMHEQMMKQFGQFFQGDSINNNWDQDFNFFFDQDKFKDLKKEFEDHFNQDKDSHIQKMGITSNKNNPGFNQSLDL